MYRTTGDKRVTQSAEKLYCAFVELLQYQKFEKISIKAVCEQAGVGRATFYRNFDYVEDILRFKLAQSFEQLDQLHLSDHFMETDKATDLAEFYRFWTGKSELLEILISANLWTLFDEAYHAASNSRMAQLNHAFSLTETQSAYLGHAIRAGMSATLQMWLSRGKQETPSELVELFILLFDTFHRIP